ncbi:MAG: hypothetical protein ACREEM_19110, partial [Blastocatellia bacterium]
QSTAPSVRPEAVVLKGSDSQTRQKNGGQKNKDHWALFFIFLSHIFLSDRFFYDRARTQCRKMGSSNRHRAPSGVSSAQRMPLSSSAEAERILRHLMGLLQQFITKWFTTNQFTTERL